MTYTLFLLAISVQYSYVLVHIESFPFCKPTLLLILHSRPLMLFLVSLEGNLQLHIAHFTTAFCHLWLFQVPIKLQR